MGACCTLILQCPFTKRFVDIKKFRGEKKECLVSTYTIEIIWSIRNLIKEPLKISCG